jgi:hypothetical protein
MPGTESQPKETDPQPQRKRALFGVQSEYVDALERRVAQVEDALAQAKSKNTGLEDDLQSAQLALKETAGWSERLPEALETFASLAAGELPEKHAEQVLAEAVLNLAGEHLLASVDIKHGDTAGKLEHETQRNEQGRPIRTTVRAGTNTVNCTWQPAVEAGPDTAEVVESLATAVVCSLAGVANARAERDVVTQLGDKKSLARHLALRQREQHPMELINVTVDRESAIAYRELFGRMAWSAGLAQTAAILDDLARDHGGQAYQQADREFKLLVDADQAERACELAEEAFADQEGLVFRVEIARR